MSDRLRLSMLLLGLVVPGIVLAMHGLSAVVPPLQWWPSLVRPDPSSLREVVAADSLLPRAAAALLCGAGLGLSGALAQMALRNPLAAPGTLGVSAGASLALSLATLYAPELLVLSGRDSVACAGGVLAIGLVLTLASRSLLDPVTVALAGLAFGLYAGSIAAVLSVLHTRQLTSFYVWSAGSLTQLGWETPRALLLRVGLGAAASGLLARPLSLQGLPDAVASSLGVNVRLTRGLALAVSVGLAASVVGQVGVIGFVGLAAPALARLGGMGRRTLLWAPLLGAALLLLTDQVVQTLSDLDGALLPTGAVSALLGAPLLLWLLPKVATTVSQAPTASLRRASRALPILLALLALLASVSAAALLAGRTESGWLWSADMLDQRLPRVIAAGIAGIALAIAGTVLQRVLGNAMASPEVLGLGTGAVAGSVGALWLGLAGLGHRLAFGAAGAGAVLALLLAFARRRSGATQIVLAGVAVSAASDAGAALLLASGDPRAEIVLTWLSGSTYGADISLALAAVALLSAGVLATAAMARWLELLPLGPVMASALGMPDAARACVLVLVTLLTALGALLAGPLSFTGLVAPQVARLLGLHAAGTQLAAAGLAGATVLVAADWLGRTVLFPSEVPAGLLAALLGGPVLLAALWRERA